MELLSMMRYLVLNRDGKVICNLGGYKTRRLANLGRWSYGSEVWNEAKTDTKARGIEPGRRFRAYCEAYIDENSQIVEVSEIIYKTSDGRTIKVSC